MQGASFYPTPFPRPPSKCSMVIQAGGKMEHFFRFHSVRANHNGTLHSRLGLNGP